MVRASFFSQIRHQNALTEIAWKEAVQGLGMAMSTVASDKNVQEIVRLSVTCFTNSYISARCFTRISRARPPENRNINPQQEARFLLWKTSPRERRKWSLGLGQPLKARR